MVFVRRVAAVLTVAACSAALVAAPASAQGGPEHRGKEIKVIAEGLNGPYELSPGRHGTIYVTETDIGQVTAVNTRTGRKTPVLTGLGTNAAVGAVRVGHKFAVLTGASEPPDTPAPPPGTLPGSSVLTARPGGTPRQLADLEKFELANNPDGQTQFGPDGVPLDALSNPFFLLKDRSRRGFLLVADGGANDVLKVSRSGKVSTFFVPPTVNTGACAGLPNNDAKTVGCDAVPTGLAYGPNNTLYVSALTAEVAGEGRVYVLNATTGKLKRVITGFTGPTGVAVDHRGTVYVSELLEGLPPGDEPPPGFDPSTVGQIVKVTRDGHRTAAQVTMPIGLLLQNGKLYSSAWSVGGLFLGTPDLGQVVEVRKSAFKAMTS